MGGQGSPTKLIAPCGLQVSLARLVVLACCGLLSWCAPTMAGPSDEPTVRLRVAWGGGARQAWHGTVQITRGRFANLVPLGIEADEPGSMWIQQGQVHIRQRSGRTYDAFDVVAHGDEQTTIRVRLNNGSQQTDVSIPLAQLSDGAHNSPIDNEGNRLFVRRAPGDRLRFRASRDQLIFTPGETMSFRLEPQLPEVDSGVTLQAKLELRPARGDDVLWQREIPLKAPTSSDEQLEIPVEVTLPQQEGAYTIQATVETSGLAQRLVPARLRNRHILAERQIQLLVLSSEPNPAPRQSSNLVDRETMWRQVAEIDPANPGWWKRLLPVSQTSLIPSWKQGPLQSGQVDQWRHPLGRMTRLALDSGRQQTSWEAFPLPILKTGIPHVLEIEYPSDVPQYLGVSIVEPNAAGNVLPIGLDSGFYQEPGLWQSGPRSLTHRVVFWPNTEAPMALLTGLGKQHAAVFRKLRVLAGPARLARPRFSARKLGGRLAAAYLDRPLLAESFSAPQGFDPVGNQSIHDWETFYLAGTRAVDYLNHMDLGGMMVSVLADGSTIYPSRHLQPTPRYDTGVLGEQGADPLRKDGLEMLFRLFDRDKLRLIPALQFAAPLPELEDLLRSQPELAASLRWTGADGRVWQQYHQPTRGLAPYYNVLHPRVQQAMLRVVDELVTRYGRHPSFDGLALQLTEAGYAVLPGAEWGFDDDTIARFQQQTGIRVPQAKGLKRFARRAEFLLGPQRAAWLEWRADVLTNFYRQIHQRLARQQADAVLYLAGSELLSSPAAQQRLRPGLPESLSLDDALLELGIQATRFQPLDRVVLLRPRRCGPPDGPGGLASDLNINAPAELDRTLAATSQPGVLLYHPPDRRRLPSFDAQSPFGKDKTYMLLVTQPLASQALSRRRFIRALAHMDATSLFDGGWLLPMGQDEAVRPLLRAYSQLPAEKFVTSPESRQGVTIRTYQGRDDTYVYLLNRSPWSVQATVHLKASPACLVADLRATSPPKRLPREPSGSTWVVRLEPYDLVAAQFSEPQVAVLNSRVEVIGNVERALDQRIRDLTARASALPNLPALEVLQNADFETASDDGPVPGWEVSGRGRYEAKVDQLKRHSGQRSLRLSADRQGASLASPLFTSPGTGRLSLAVWLRTDEAEQQPVFQLAIEGPDGGQRFNRFARVGGPQPGLVPLKTNWTSYVFQVDDVPTTDLDQLRVRFDLLGAGNVWIDDVEIHHLSFNKNERVELSKILVSAAGALRSGELADCAQILEGYWPRFLERHVPESSSQIPLSARAERRATITPSRPAKSQPDRSRGFVDRIKRLVPKWSSP